MYHIITCFKLTSNMKIHPLKIQRFCFSKTVLNQAKRENDLKHAVLYCNSYLSKQDYSIHIYVGSLP